MIRFMQRSGVGRNMLMATAVIVAGGLTSIVISIGAHGQIEPPPLHTEMVPPKPTEYCIYEVTDVWTATECANDSLQRGDTLCSQCPNSKKPGVTCAFLNGGKLARAITQPGNCEVSLLLSGGNQCDTCQANGNKKSIKIK
jgi:hypothetical protein